MLNLQNARYTQMEKLGELEALRIRHPLIDATILLQGGHLVHFAPAGDDNWLWLSPLARFEKGVAVRGGIPVCWPWFGDPTQNPDQVSSLVESTKAHGFARTVHWFPRRIEELEEAVSVTLSLDTAQSGTRYPWKGLASAELTFRFAPESLSLALTTRNAGTDPLVVTQALHTYLPTEQIAETRIQGLEGADYLDTLDRWDTKKQAGDVTFDGETDRIYLAAPDIQIQSPGSHYRLTSVGSRSTVVWNPGPDKSVRLSDFPNDAWTGMLCVETANAAKDCREIAAGASHTLAMVLTQR